MAEPAVAYHHGEQDIREQRSTFHMVMFATKWFTLHLVAALTLLTLWFCTAAGFFTGLITAVILVALGTFFLSDKGQAH